MRRSCQAYSRTPELGSGVVERLRHQLAHGLDIVAQHAKLFHYGLAGGFVNQKADHG